MTIHTQGQRLAQAAYAQVTRHGVPGQEYVSFAKSFPALIHTCGLAEAVAFAQAKKKKEYLKDLTEVLKASGHHEITAEQPLDHHTRHQELSAYLRLSRAALKAAEWLKRYVEVLGVET